MFRVIMALSLAIALLLLLYDESVAHSELRSSVPADGVALREAPAEAVLVFDEAARVTAIRLFDATGARIELPGGPETTSSGKATVALPPLSPGAFELEWRAISLDGHPIRGRIHFSVVE
jgi:methionine-rich copper-binding protein CopC